MQKGHVRNFTPALSSHGLRSAFMFEPKGYDDQLDVDSPSTSKICVFLGEETILTALVTFPEYLMLSMVPETQWCYI